MPSPMVAAITLHPTGGGVAAVADLLWRVHRQADGRTRLVTLFDHENRPATFAEKTAFGLSMARAQLFHRTDWMMFSHLGLAQVQNGLPAAIRRPYGVFLHGIEAWRDLSAAETRALANAQVRVANSSYTAGRVMGAHPGIGLVHPCPLALPPASTTDVAQAASTHAVGAHAVLVVGRMSSNERYKGHDQMIEAWPAVVSCVPDAQLVIVGSGDDLDRLQAKAAQTTAAHRILFTGFVSRAELESLYRQSAVFALPSRGEGFGLVYLEAMSHGLPCVGSRHDAAVDVIADGETGWLVDQADADSLRDRIVTLLNDAALRRRMGEAGRDRLRREFSFDRFRARLLQLLPPMGDSGPTNRHA